MAIPKKTTTRKTTTTTAPKVMAKTTPRKPVVKKAVVKAPVASAKLVKPVVQVKEEVPSLRKKELIDTVVLRSGMKKKYAKPVVEAMLEILGETIALKKEMNLQPFGKVMVKKQMDKTSAVVSVVRIRQSKVGKTTRPTSPSEQAAE